MKIDILETFDNKTKQNVKVQNNSETAVYIRVALVPTWVDETTHEPVAQSASLDDLTFTNLPASGWKKNGSYYYYTLPVPAGSETPVLFSSAVVKDGAAPAGCIMDLQVLAQAVQATPKDAVIAAWGKAVADQLAPLN